MRYILRLVGDPVGQSEHVLCYAGWSLRWSQECVVGHGQGRGGVISIRRGV